MELEIDPASTGLLVIDMQNAFCHPEGTLAKDGADITGMRGVVQPLAGVIQRCQEAGIQDFWSQQEHYAQDAARARHKIKPHTLKRFQVASQRGTWDAEIVEELKPLITERSEVLKKNRFGCFYNTRLETLLRIHGTDTIVVTGVATNTCVDTTVREAYLRDLDVVVLSDCVGGVNPTWHTAALQVWARFIGAVVSSDELLAALPSESARPA